ncbi:SDR family oxidoreductase [Pseudomonas baltica]|jgi:NAD(P)-dependent dehydrogenase (short-subunit alcohol dehydrogenase family)|uniref:SDR family oxidoreductase n=1 Tax=Pseudomonas baltica TaxID=2762576 RepID=UPI0028A1C384|nr:SDR family oxidoreductase [Pseudomonas baltica]
MTYSPDSQTIPAQSQDRAPGSEKALQPAAVHIRPDYRGSGKLKGKRTLITGGDSGIGRAAALHFAREGADVAILHLPIEQDDANDTLRLIEAEGVRALSIAGDIADRAVCDQAIATVVATFGGIDVLVNNAAHMRGEEEFTDTTDESWLRHFEVNVHGAFYLTRAALGHMGKGSSIIQTTSVNAFAGAPVVTAYTATKAALAGFTRALALQVANKGIRVNEVAPGPIWTPIQPQGWPAEQVPHMGDDTPMGRMGHPAELGAAYVYLASEDASYVTGQTLHVNGGMIVNG